MNGERKAIVLLSGGLDSTTTLAIAKAAGFSVYALTFRYGQTHELEVEAARRVAAQLEVARHIIIDVDLRSMGASALTGAAPVPKDRSVEEIGHGIPSTYVPARNTIFLSFALAWAEALGAEDLFIGVNAVDYSGYPDCRPEYIAAFEQLANLATKAGVEGHHLTVHAPLLHMTKAEIVRAGLGHGVDFALTLTCYDPLPGSAACGCCDACVLRLKGFAENGLTDPALYVPAPAAARCV